MEIELHGGDEIRISSDSIDEHEFCECDATYEHCGAALAIQIRDAIDDAVKEFEKKHPVTEAYRQRKRETGLRRSALNLR